MATRSAFEKELQKAIPSELRRFPKLTEGDPYRYLDWQDAEDEGGPVLRYWFWNREHTRQNKKRLFVREMAALLNAREFDKAYGLLRDGAPPRNQFMEAFAQYSSLNVRVGASGDQEGAAGSIYVKVPLIVAGTLEGKPIVRRADVVLRRVNDVPGSNEAERRWHVERIEWADTGSLVR